MGDARTHGPLDAAPAGTALRDLPVRFRAGGLAFAGPAGLCGACAVVGRVDGGLRPRRGVMVGGVI